MSESRTDCQRFEEALLDSGPDADLRSWHDHLEGCAGCREQWAAHRMLVATLAEEVVPELSPAFQAGLHSKIDLALEFKPLRGWRLVAMIGYALAAVLLLRWVFTQSPLPALDLSSPWVTVAALIVVPLSFWLTIAATRLLPTARPKGLNLLSL